MADEIVKIDFDDHEVRAALNRLAEVASDLTPAFRAIAGVLADASERAFRDEADPVSGEKWDDLADSTKAARGKRGQWPGSILQATGTLASALQSDHGSDFAELTIGSEIEQAAIMQFGGDAGRGHKVHIPARPFIGISNDDEVEIMSIIADHIATALK